MADFEPFIIIDDIPKIHASLRSTFRTGRTQPIAWRRHQLHQLARFVKENQDGLVAAIHADLGKPIQEIVMGEITPVFERSLISAGKLDEWCAPVNLQAEVPDWQKAWNPRMVRRSKGVVLIIAPWNYPMILSLQPLYGAIAAGCCVLLKLSEISPHYASFIARHLPKYLDPECFHVALGGIPEITKILEYKWDHIFYTGNGRVARIISAAAAKHLTPLTLELGGKSPVIVTSTADVALAAKRILWGKTTNCGQICVAPDYILAERSILPQLLQALKDTLKTFYPQGALNTESYGRIVSPEHFTRLTGLLKRTKGTVVAGGELREGEKAIEPTVVSDVEPGDSLLEGEIFGPLLPIVAVDNVDAAIDYINDHDHPLVLYFFTTDAATKEKILNNTTSGNVLINDTFNQLSINQLPFGGVGESGYGRQVLFASFENFVFTRGVSEISYDQEQFFRLRYPPYTKQSLEFFSQVMQTPIPESTNPAANGV